jgi:uncharacterized protein with ParB-like and HNH nuclease domain
MQMVKHAAVIESGRKKGYPLGLMPNKLMTINLEVLDGQQRITSSDVL